VVAFRAQLRDENTLVVANLSRFVQHVELDLAKYGDPSPSSSSGARAFPAVGDRPYTLSLGCTSSTGLLSPPGPEPVSTLLLLHRCPSWRSTTNGSLFLKGDSAEPARAGAPGHLFLSSRFSSKGAPQDCRIVDVHSSRRRLATLWHRRDDSEVESAERSSRSR